MQTLGTASIAAFRQYLRAAEHAGMDTEPLLHQCEMSRALLDTDDGRITGQQFQRFLRLVIDQSGNPVFGLQSGDFVQPGSYSVLGYITMSCATLGEAVARIVPFEKLVGDMGTTKLSTANNHITLTWHCQYEDSVVRPHMVDNVFASWINYARWLADKPDASPEKITLRRPSPGRGLESEYQQRWGCPVEFDTSADSITISADLLQTRLRQPDPMLRKTLEAHALNQLATLDDTEDLSVRVRQGIQHQLSQGVTRQDMVAESLGMTSRTLQRKLSKEGVSYQKLLDEVRQTMAEELLRESSLAIPEIAMRLGYSETTSFHRKFKLATGQTPGDFRLSDGQSPTSR